MNKNFLYQTGAIEKVSLWEKVPTNEDSNLWLSKFIWKEKQTNKTKQLNYKCFLVLRANY